MSFTKTSREHLLEEQVLARLRSENIDYFDKRAAVACLEECVMPRVCVNAYLNWYEQQVIGVE